MAKIITKKMHIIQGKLFNVEPIVIEKPHKPALIDNDVCIMVRITSRNSIRVTSHACIEKANENKIPNGTRAVRIVKLIDIFNE